jgi:mannose-6-phosphate isomerase-like protein (cupin superfamily)
MTTATEAHKAFKIFRAKDARLLMETGCMAIAPITAQQREGVMKAVEAGYTEGDVTKVLVQMPGFSLTHTWMKKNYPLSLHSHDSDCMYYIVAGTTRVGTEDLGPRDCFFVPANVPYTHKPGPDGVEVLEIRHETNFDFVNLSKTEAFWDKATQIVAANLEDWRTAQTPSGIPL